MGNSNRRVFLRNFSLASAVVLLSSGFLRRPKTSGFTAPIPEQEDPPPKINPAYQVNFYQDGSVELYTHNAQNEKQSHKFEGLEAELLRKIMEHENPAVYSTDIAGNYSLDNSNYAARVGPVLKSMEDHGYIYYGEPMLVKVLEKTHE